MIHNTSNLTIFFGIGIILLTLAGLIAAFVIVRKNIIEPDKLDKLIELGKWFIASVAIVVGTAIVSDSFKEREQDVAEIGVFDKYVTTITEADGIEKRWLLAEYFSIVAPPGELRDSWAHYKDYLKPKLDEYRANKERIVDLASKEQPTESDQVEIAKLQQQTTLVEQSLVNRQTPIDQSSGNKANADEWAIFSGGDTTIEAAKFELNKARKISPDAQIYKKGNWFRTVIPHFSDRDDALNRLPEVKRVVNANAYINRISDWCPNPAAGAEYVTCN
jgi:hypothetical protein